jgi:hypothetical protein
VEMMLSSKQAHGIEMPVSVIADAPAIAFRRVFFKNMPDTERNTTRFVSDNVDELLTEPAMPRPLRAGGGSAA